MVEHIRGKCLCGAVQYEITGEAVAAGDCYCEDCRRSSGTAYCSNVGFVESDVALTGELSDFAQPADSGAVVTRSFCPKCGSPISSTNSNMPGLVFIRASSLNDLERYQPQFTVFASRAPSWAPPSPQRPSFPEMPPPEKMPS